MRIHMDDDANKTNLICGFDADDKQIGCVRWVDLVTHKYEQAIHQYPDAEETLAGGSIQPEGANISAPTGKMTLQTGTYARVEITPRPITQQG